MANWIYVIEAMGQHLFKVGFTTTAPEERLRQLRTGSPHKLEILVAFTCSAPEQVEAQFHRFLTSYSGAKRAHGEWFSLTREAMLEIMMTFFAKLAQREGLTESKAPRRLDESSGLLNLVRLCEIRNRSSLNLDAIRQRALRATEGRPDEKEHYSIWEVSGNALIGDVDDFGYMDVPFEALAIGGPSASAHHDHVLALFPRLHGNAQANAEFFANARYDILALLDEVDRLTHKGDR